MRCHRARASSPPPKNGVRLDAGAMSPWSAATVAHRWQPASVRVMLAFIASRCSHSALRAPASPSSSLRSQAGRGAPLPAARAAMHCASRRVAPSRLRGAPPPLARHRLKRPSASLRACDASRSRPALSAPGKTHSQVKGTSWRSPEARRARCAVTGQQKGAGPHRARSDRQPRCRLGHTTRDRRHRRSPHFPVTRVIALQPTNRKDTAPWKKPQSE